MAHGYIVLHHGAVLVKMRNTGPLPSTERPGSQAETDADIGGNEADMAADDEVRAVMARELDLVAVKTALELALYVALLLWGFFGIRWFRSKLIGGSDRRLRWFAAGVASWIIPWTFAASPLLLLGYGNPLFTNWMGPGALSWSTGYPISWSPGLSVSYRWFIEMASFWPVLLLATVAHAVMHYLPAMSGGMVVWIAGVLFYGFVGGLRGLAAGAAEPR